MKKNYVEFIAMLVQSLGYKVVFEYDRIHQEHIIYIDTILYHEELSKEQIQIFESQYDIKYQFNNRFTIVVPKKSNENPPFGGVRTSITL